MLSTGLYEFTNGSVASVQLEILEFEVFDLLKGTNPSLAEISINGVELL